MQKLHLTLGMLALSAMVAGLGACSDDLGALRPRRGGRPAGAGAGDDRGRLHPAPVRAPLQPLQDLGGRARTDPAHW